MKNDNNRMAFLSLLIWSCLVWISCAFLPIIHRAHNVQSSKLVMQAKLCDGETDRRKFIGGLTAAAFLANSNPVDARGLVLFPCTEPLGNTYHFMRAGESLLEVDDIWSTNPLFLTNREAALSDRGIEEVERACRQFKSESINPTLVRYSLAASATDTANIVARELRIGRDRVVPEFNFMDPRSVGKWDMLPLSATQTAVWAMDNDEAGPEGMGARPPANEDGTPHETLADQVVRLRQLISVLETQFSGEIILLVFPDGTGPALLSAMVAGIPLNRAHELEFQPGEVRLNVTMKSTLALAATKSTPEYTATLEQGREELQRLRSTSPDAVVSVQDQQLEQEQIEIEKEVQRRQNERKANEEAILAERKAREEAVRAERKAKVEEARAAQRERTQQLEAERQRRRDESKAARQQELSQKRAESEVSDQNESDGSVANTILGSVGALLLGGLAVASTSNNSGEDAVQQRSEVNSELEATSDANASTQPHGEEIIEQSLGVKTESEVASAVDPSTQPRDAGSRTEVEEPLVDVDLDDQPEDELDEDKSLNEPATNRQTITVNGGSSVFDAPNGATANALQTPAQTTQPPQTFDDGGDSWLQSLAEIIQEDDDVDLDGVDRQ